MKITVNKKEFQSALEIAAKIASGTGRIREYDRVYIGVDSSKPNGIFIIGKGSGAAIQITLTVKAREVIALADGELIEFCAKGVLDELKTYDTADVDFTAQKSTYVKAAENDVLFLHLGSFTEYADCFRAWKIKNDFVFTNTKDRLLTIAADKLSHCLKSVLPFVQKPGYEFTDEYWACGVNLGVTGDVVALKSTDQHTLAHADIQDDFGKHGDDFEATLKPGALNILVKNVIRKDDDNSVIISPGAENEPCVIRYLNYTLNVQKINQRYKYGKELVPTVWDYSITLPKSEFIDALKDFIKDCGKEHSAYFKLKAHVDYIAFEDTKGLGFEYGMAGKKSYGKTGFEIGFNAPMLLSVLKAIQWSGDEVKFSVHLNKDKKYACAGALFSDPNNENKDIEASWYVCEVMLNAGE